MKILMSIKPKYVEKIISGEKQYEFRKKRWHKRGLEWIVIYSCRPVQRIVGEFKIDYLQHLDLYTEEDLLCAWDFFCNVSGISLKEFYTYYANSKMGYAIRIGRVHLYDRPYMLQERYPHLKRPPQSFCYVED